jgi:PAS domain S-box-containing protein
MAEAPDGAELARRARVLRQGAFALLCCVPLYTAFFLVAGVGLGAPTLIVMASGVAVLPVFPLARRGRHLGWLANYVVAILWSVLLGVGWRTGGTASATEYWLAAVPLVALVLAGWRSSVIWTLVIFAHGGWLFALEAAGRPLPQVLPGEWPLVFRAWGLSTLAILLLALGGVSERARAAARAAEHRQQQLRRASEASFRALIEQIPDAIAVHRAGRFVYVNRALLDLLRYERAEDLAGRPVVEIVHPDHRDAVARRIGEVVSAGTAAPAREEVLLRADGGSVTAEVVALQVEFGGESCVLAIGRDLTERKRFLASLMQMDRMLAVGTLAAGVAHEINNPLAFVAANIEAVREHLNVLSKRGSGGGPDGDDGDLVSARAAIADAEVGTDRIRAVVRDLSTFSRSDDGEARKKVDVRRVLDSAINMADNQIRHRARLVRDYRDVPPVEGNEARLAQVFLNLLVNAAQAIEVGAAERNEIRVRTRARDGRVVVEVEDTGCGLPDTVKDRVFDPFFTTKPVGEGTGLGLTISLRLVEALGGTLELESVLGQGTTVRASLPAATGASAPDAAAPSVVGCPAGPRARVLVVDDEPLVGRGLQRILGKEHEVVVVLRAADVLSFLEAGERFDVILCDMMMPETTGMDLYGAIVSRFPEEAARVVFLTGGAFTARERAFLDETRRPVVEKPFDAEVLRALVSRIARGGP